MSREQFLIAAHDGQVQDKMYLAEELARLRAINEKLLAALERLVADYEDVPDPSDADGQAVFEQARAAIAMVKGQYEYEMAREHGPDLARER